MLIRHSTMTPIRWPTATRLLSGRRSPPILATVRPADRRRGVRDLAYITGGAGLHQRPLRPRVCSDANTPPGTGTASACGAASVGLPVYGDMPGRPVGRSARSLLRAFQQRSLATSSISENRCTARFHRPGSTRMRPRRRELRVLTAQERDVFDRAKLPPLSPACARRAYRLRRGAPMPFETTCSITISNRSDRRHHTVAPGAPVPRRSRFLPPSYWRSCRWSASPRTAHAPCACRCSIFDVGGLDLPQKSRSWRPRFSRCSTATTRLSQQFGPPRLLIYDKEIDPVVTQLRSISIAIGA